MRQLGWPERWTSLLQQARVLAAEKEVVVCLYRVGPAPAPDLLAAAFTTGGRPLR